MASDVDITHDAGRETEGVIIREKKREDGKQGAKEKAYVTLQRDLILRLNHLRAEAHQTCEAYLANIDSDVATLVEFLNGSSEVHKPKDVKAGTMESWMKTMRNTSVKPDKGRSKDLRRINKAIQSMMETAFE